MKIIGAIFFSFIVLTMNMKSGLHLFIYEVAKPYIIENYCVNIDNEEFQCDGQCHLKDVIAESANTTSENDIPLPEVEIKQVFFMPTASIELGEEELPIVFFEECTTLHLEEFITEVFHPPTKA